MKLLRFIGPTEYMRLNTGKDIKPLKAYTDTKTTFSGIPIMYFFEYTDIKDIQYYYEAMDFNTGMIERPWYVIIAEIPNSRIERGLGTYYNPEGNGAVDLNEYGIESYSSKDVIKIYRLDYKTKYTFDLKEIRLQKAVKESTAGGNMDIFVVIEAYEYEGNAIIMATTDKQLALEKLRELYDKIEDGISWYPLVLIYDGATGKELGYLDDDGWGNINEEH